MCEQKKGRIKTRQAKKKKKEKKKVERGIKKGKDMRLLLHTEKGKKELYNLSFCLKNSGIVTVSPSFFIFLVFIFLVHNSCLSFIIFMDEIFFIK